MKTSFFALLFTFCVVFFSCNNIFHETIKGNGHYISEVRNVSEADDIKSLGSFDVTVVQGTSASVKVEADDNLLPYIITQTENGKLIIKTKDHVDFSSDNKIKITVTTDKLRGAHIAGSGNISSTDTFVGSDELNLDVEGTGDISLSVNTPSVTASIAGTGNISLAGETKDSKITIAGVGDYKAENLKSENVDIHIAGSGNAKVFASSSLSIEIAGSGDVYYHGTPTIHQNIAGSGTIKQLP